MINAPGQRPARQAWSASTEVRKTVKVTPWVNAIWSRFAQVQSDRSAEAHLQASTWRCARAPQRLQR